MPWLQTQFSLSPRARGCHLITGEIQAAVADLRSIKVGLCNIFLLHTSASLTINENADSDVRRDLEMALNRIAPEDLPYVHTEEGVDDMPAHVKAALLGNSLCIPISNGRLVLGTWQGIYLCEHRNQGGRRQVVVTIWGDKSTNDEIQMSKE